ncbi:E3 ubiquitin-protein ligase TRIM7-like [Dendropsophus ebraccatus]|uniref:E3 ubiquitin-protein ligase TRIM7-like n=1 Tax=Dendropsophus ebraccatus TaxID=150705 RepID=UPI0038319EF2
MASADLRDYLLCHICLNTFTDPVMLWCRHNFCRGCIDPLLNIQDRSGDYSCPKCGAKFPQRPTLISNIALHKVAERFMEEPPAVKCSIHEKILEYYCTEDAAYVCVNCLAKEHRQHQVEKVEEASEKKKNKLRSILRKLNTKREKTEERLRTMEERRRKALVKTSGEAERVTAQFIEIKRRLDDLEKSILSEISRQEKQLSLPMSDVIQKLEIKRDELSKKMRHIEELCNMADPLTVLQDPDTGDLCDPEEEGGDEDTGGHDGGDEDTGGHDGGDEDTAGHDGGDEDTAGHDIIHDVDVNVITRMVDTGISDIVTYLQTITSAKPKAMRPQPAPRPLPQTPPPGDQSLHRHTQASQHGGDDIIRAGEVEEAELKGPANILLDVTTAGDSLLISDSLKTATMTYVTQNRPETEERFEACFQVMSCSGFSSGRHYWDVETGRSDNWTVGMCYSSMDRKGRNVGIGDNNKSWGLEGRWGCNGKYKVIHDKERIHLLHRIASDRVRICLDYEAGQLSFYELCDPISHLYTFTATFTEPLHAVIYVQKGSIKILGEEL